jgi:uncharacterized protein YyaL (SSP411 family)
LYFIVDSMFRQRKPNRLLQATSPYLLQHAHNPVDWYEWGSEAHNQAKQEDKPVLVSIGYSSCHWCHVMERESFENEEVAKVMNRHFVCIKVDREERPDVDQIYMEAVQAMGMNGGWPLNVFLTPDLKPFYGGTYFPPAQWSSVLTQLHQAFVNRRKEIEASAHELTQHIGQTDTRRFVQISSGDELPLTDLAQMLEVLEAKFDSTWGGLDKAPKFVMPSIWLLLLRLGVSLKNNQAHRMVNETLHRMTYGGLYDQVGGGFARYSVDAEWFVPHFEKMLYDNGQLLSLYAEAYRLTPSPYFKTILTETVGWLSREMQNPEGGLYSALDADSEGIEGKYYLWTWREWHEALGTEAGLLAEYYQLEPEGNWEHGASILRPLASPEEFAKERNLDRAAFLTQLEKAKRLLLNRQHQRVRPGLDDKNLAGWNAMAAIGLTDAALALGEQSWLDQAEQVMKFVSHNLMDGEKIFRSWKGKRSPTEGFLEDYAFVIAAFLKLYQGTGHEIYLSRAERIAQYTLDHFQDADDGYFFYTSSVAEELIARKKEIFDNVIPSSNAVMARNLLHLGIMLDRPAWVEMARRMVKGLQHIVRQEPVYMCHWGLVMAELVHGLAEVVIQGPECRKLFLEFQRHYKPYALWMMSPSGSPLPLFQNRISPPGETRIHICYNRTCQMPVNRVDDALPLFK